MRIRIGSRRTKAFVLAIACLSTVVPEASARGGGGFRGGGGSFGGFRGGGGMSMARPSFSGGNMGGFSRPSYGGASSFRPSGEFRPSVGGGGRTEFGGVGRGEFGGRGLENMGGATHPNFGQRPPWESGGPGRNISGNIGNRTNIGSGNIGNRANVGNRNFDNIGNRNFNNIGNRGNFDNNRINVNTGNIGRGNFNGWGGYRPGGWGYRPGYGWRPGYWGNHGNWYNGYWGWHRPIVNNFYGGWGMGGFGWGLGTGLLLGGLSGWAMGSSLCNWGYMPYSNPYYVPSNTVVVSQPVYVEGASQPTYSETNYNYAQPIDTEAPAPDQTVTDTALNVFDLARQSFMNGQYQEALTGVEQALAKLPNDAVLHEFRALTLFAMGRFADSAATLYPVLSIQPGMDWTSLSSLYPDVNVFTGQLRALEAQRDAKPDDPSIRFLLGYLYSCMGFKDQAATQYEKIVALQPKDTLSAGLLKAIKTPETAPADATNPEIAQPTAQPPQQSEKAKNPAPATMLAGSWTAAPGDGRSIALDFQADSKFAWSFTPSGGKPNVFKGTYTYADGVLTLVSNQNGQVMVGRVEKVSDSEFQFVWVGAGQGEPGLDFRKN